MLFPVLGVVAGPAAALLPFALLLGATAGCCVLKFATQPAEADTCDAVAAMGAGWIGSWLGKIAARVTAVWAEPEQEPVDGEVVPEGEASAAEEVAIDVSGEAVAGEVTGRKMSAPHQFHEEVEIAPEQPPSPGFSNLQAELRAEGEFAFDPEAEA